MKAVLTIAKQCGILILFLWAATKSLAQSPQKPLSRWSLEYRDSINRLQNGTEYVPFDITTLDGRQISTATSPGKVTMLFFWFESCSRCREEFDELNALYDSLKNNANCQFAAITFDDSASIPGFIAKYHLHYPVATTSEAQFKKLNYNNGCPSVVVLDKNLKVALCGTRALTFNEDNRFEISVPVFLEMERMLAAQN